MTYRFGVPRALAAALALSLVVLFLPGGLLVVGAALLARRARSS